jgi:hypothetical protein
MIGTGWTLDTSYSHLTVSCCYFSIVSLIVTQRASKVKIYFYKLGFIPYISCLLLMYILLLCDFL